MTGSAFPSMLLIRPANSYWQFSPPTFCCDKLYSGGPWILLSHKTNPFPCLTCFISLDPPLVPSRRRSTHSDELRHASGLHEFDLNFPSLCSDQRVSIFKRFHLAGCSLPLLLITLPLCPIPRPPPLGLGGPRVGSPLCYGPVSERSLFSSSTFRDISSRFGKQIVDISFHSLWWSGPLPRLPRWTFC